MDSHSTRLLAGFQEESIIAEANLVFYQTYCKLKYARLLLPITEFRGIMLDPTRLELLQKSRSFLDAPEIRSADETTKKEFLKSKGLQEEEITQLLAPESNSSPQAPLVSTLPAINVE